MATLSPTSFLGGGRMAEALIGGILSSELSERGNIFVFDPCLDRQQHLKKKFGVKIVGSNTEAVSHGKNIIIAVKPQTVPELLKELAIISFRGKQLISIAAGIRISRYEKALSPTPPVCRVMPNTPCLIKQGISALSFNQEFNQKQKKEISAIFAAVGEIIEVEEKYLDAITALSGSGPAYCYQFAEAMAQGGKRQQLDYNLALKLAAQTMVGAGQMILRGDKTTTQLINDVMSPHGTTMAGMKVLQSSPLESIMNKTITAAAKRAEEIARDC